MSCHGSSAGVTPSVILMTRGAPAGGEKRSHGPEAARSRRRLLETARSCPTRDLLLDAWSRFDSTSIRSLFQFDLTYIFISLWTWPRFDFRFSWLLNFRSARKVQILILSGDRFLQFWSNFWMWFALVRGDPTTARWNITLEPVSNLDFATNSFSFQDSKLSMDMHRKTKIRKSMDRRELKIY